MEGWHRTMNYLVFDHNETIGAPQDQIEILKNGGDIRQIDFSKWRPVPISAFVGIKNNQQTSMRGKALSPGYLTPQQQSVMN